MPCRGQLSPDRSNRVGQTQSPGCSICGLCRLPPVDSRRVTQPKAKAATASVKITIVTHSGSTPILNDPTHSKNPAIHADHMSFCILSPLPCRLERYETAYCVSSSHG